MLQVMPVPALDCLIRSLNVPAMDNKKTTGPNYYQLVQVNLDMQWSKFDAKPHSFPKLLNGRLSIKAAVLIRRKEVYTTTL